MIDSTRPSVEEAPPPRSLVRGLNVVLRRLLCSPLHRPFSARLMLLVVTGRKTGRTYVVPVGRHEANGAFLVSAMGAWRENLRGGAAVRVVVDGRTHAGYAELEEDPDQVAHGYKVLLDELGRKPRDLGLKVNVRRSPTIEELKPALTGRRIVRVRLNEDPRGAPTLEPRHESKNASASGALRCSASASSSAREHRSEGLDYHPVQERPRAHSTARAWRSAM